MLTFLLIFYIIQFVEHMWRSVAQFGRALRSGRRGRVFESRRFDEKYKVSEVCYGFPASFFETSRNLIFSLITVEIDKSKAL